MRKDQCRSRSVQEEVVPLDGTAEQSRAEKFAVRLLLLPFLIGQAPLPACSNPLPISSWVTPRWVGRSSRRELRSGTGPEVETDTNFNSVALRSVCDTKRVMSITEMHCRIGD